tara:strand:+ start:3401 stop:4714 length:1314 start_codon:yes stop_codon:yes gene_type:complete
MSLYSSESIKTHILDPVYFRSNHQARFVLPANTNLISNFRLVNIGATVGTTATPYNGLGGCLGCIESIQLMDGNVLLDQLLQAPIYNAFNQVNNSNQAMKDMLPNTVRNKAGMFYGGQLNDSSTDNYPKLRVWDVSNTNINIDDITTKNGRVSLMQMLPFLQNQLLINTSVFKNLTLVVNFSTNPDDYARTTNNEQFKTVQPQLIVDESQNTNNPQTNFQYDIVEHDRFNVPSGADKVNATNKSFRQTFTNKVSGFDNKLVKRMLLCKSPTLKSTYQSTVGVNNRYGPLGSKSFFKESLQVRLNGSNIYPASGIVSENSRLNHLNQVFGNLSLYPFANGSAYINAATDGDRTANIEEGNQIISELDYYGVRINSEVSDLQIEFGREINWVTSSATDPASKTATDTASINQSFDMNCYAQLRRAITFSNDGSYTVTYV